MKITAGSLKEFKDLFSKEFPFLKLEFFKTNSKLKASHIRDMLPASRLVENQSIVLDVVPEMTVEEFEGNFYGKFHFPAQIFRKSGNVWLETTTSDSWSLLHQNEHGKESCRNEGTSQVQDDLELN
jgi:hypothetical protein